MSTHFHQDLTLISRGAAGREQHFLRFALKSLLLFQNRYLVWMPYHNFFVSTIHPFPYNLIFVLNPH